MICEINENDHRNAASLKSTKENNERFAKNTHRFYIHQQLFPIPKLKHNHAILYAILFAETTVMFGKTFLKDFLKVTTNNCSEYFKNNWQ